MRIRARTMINYKNVYYARNGVLFSFILFDREKKREYV